VLDANNDFLNARLALLQVIIVLTRTAAPGHRRSIRPGWGFRLSRADTVGLSEIRDFFAFAS
jgi:hypothetical protein